MFSDKLVVGLMERYGRAVRILSPEENAAAIDCRAFVQPLRYKNKMYLNGVYLPSGYDDGRHYLYLGPADVRLDLMPFGVCVQAGEERYLVKRAEKVHLEDRVLYIWAILQTCGEEDA